jgi:putative DNA primase/helicase
MARDNGPAGEWVKQADIREIQRTWDNAPARTLDATVNPQGKKTYRLVKAEDVIIRPLDYLWKGHLLRGAQELMTGIKGQGKSQIHCSLVACATTGRPWPNGAKGCKPGNVIMVTAEDQKDTTVVPRLILAGADLSRVFFLEAIKHEHGDKERMFLLGEDIDTLEQIMKDVGDICMVTIDPITAFMGKINSSSPTDVRGQLGPLAKLAERANVAFSTITHPPKNNNQGAINSFIGSQSFIAAARIGHLCVPEMKVDNTGLAIPTGRKLYTSVQANHEPMPAIAYTIEPETIWQQPKPTGDERADRLAHMKSIVEQVEAVKIDWYNELNVSADEALRATTHKGPSQSEQVDDFVRDLLGNRWMLSKTVVAKAKERGFSGDQVDRARKRLGVIADHMEDGQWQIRLPR